MYTIGEVSKRFGLSISTIRYYDKENIIPGIIRDSGIRKFTDESIEAINMIECLKKSGMEIKEIKQFMEWCKEGSSTYQLRRAMFQQRKEKVMKEIEHLNKTLDMLKFKCWYYDQAIADGNEDRLTQIIPEDLPKEIKELYDNAHS